MINIQIPDITKLPTDNLYKFITFVGMLVITTSLSFYFSEYSKHEAQIKSIESDKSKLVLENIQDKSELNKLTKEVNLTFDKIEDYNKQQKKLSIELFNKEIDSQELTLEQYLKLLKQLAHKIIKSDMAQAELQAIKDITKASDEKLLEIELSINSYENTFQLLKNRETKRKYKWNEITIREINEANNYYFKFRIFIFTLIAGLIITLYGSSLWYQRTQKYLDQKSKLL